MSNTRGVLEETRTIYPLREAECFWRVLVEYLLLFYVLCFVSFVVITCLVPNVACVVDS